jgi:hypothetical protein
MTTLEGRSPTLQEIPAKVLFTKSVILSEANA